MLKKIFATGAFTTLSILLYAQPATTPAAYSTTAQVNYIRTWDVSAPVSTVTDLLSRPLKDVKQATQYMDGLGRPLQTVMKQGSMPTNGTAADMVAPVVYDQLGREQYKYLPFAANSTGNYSTNDGSFKRNPFQQQAVFATTQYPGESYFYSKTNFEASPLNKVTETYAPGNSWVGSENNSNPALRHSVASDQFVNTGADEVWIWDVIPGGGAEMSTYSSSLNYDKGELMKTITKDEHGKQVIEYKDREGHTILKKVQLDAAPDDGTGSGPVDWLCTYYIYDDYGNLSGVIPPKVVVELLQQGNREPTTTMLTELCFRYKYDGRHRMIMKQVPGAGITSMVYDAFDRLVLVQDANNTLVNKWLYTKYDALSRPAFTGVWVTGDNRSTLQTAAYNSTNYPVVSGTTFEELSETHYGDAVALSTMYPYDNASFPTPSSAYPYPQALTQSSAVRGMVTDTYAKILGTINWYVRYTYYDNYGRVLGTNEFNSARDQTIITNQYSYGGQLLQSVARQIKMTPNDQTHIVQTRITYDDLGRPTKTEKKINSTISTGTILKDWSVISTLQYDAAGQLIRKNLGNKPGSAPYTPLANLNYEYNIRGWLLSLNKDYVSGGANNDEYFGMSLGYDKVAAGQNNSLNAAQYNGNINAEVWRGVNDGAQRKYDFTYDAVSRLMKADFKQYDGGWNLSAGIDYSMQMGNGIDPTTAYDPNGNILGMLQKGFFINSSIVMDNMRYTYISGTNKLKSVTDFANNPASLLGDFKTNNTHPQIDAKASLTPSSTQTSFDNITDYSYDLNGNMIADNNKNIQSIQYNYLNLPQLITIPNKGTISYSYDAGGTKLQKITNETATSDNGNRSIITTTIYLNGFVYESKHTVPANPLAPDYDNVLQFFGQEEGRVRFLPEVTGFTAADYRPADLVYDYMIKDHLGNVRTLITEEQTTHHYEASFESETRTTEDMLFGNIEETAYPVSEILNPLLPDCQFCLIVEDPVDPEAPKNVFSYDDPNDYVSKLNGSGKKIGATLTLKVMAGDKIDLGVNVWYPNRDEIGSKAPNEDVVSSLIQTLSGNVATISNGHIGTSVAGASTSPLVAGIADFLASHPDNSGNPKDPAAYINWILFDENLKYVPEGSGFIKVDGFSEDIQVLSQSDINVNKSGYLFVYLSNETEHYDVFFDDLVVDHTPSPLLEETHYYPFGLTMGGISSKAAGGMQNKRKFNKGSEFQSEEFSDGSGLELYSTFYRSIDPQLGRFWQIDPKPATKESLYSMMGNNPILFNDPLGDTLKIHYKRQNITYNSGVLTNKDGSAYKGKVKGYLKRVVNALQLINTQTEGRSMVNELQNSGNTFTIQNDDKNLFSDNSSAAFGNIPSIQKIIQTPLSKGGSGGTISWNPDILTSGMNTLGTADRPAYIGLAHEMAHAKDANEGIYYPGNDHANPDNGITDYQAQYQGVNKREWRAVYMENVIRGQMGVPLRTSYDVLYENGAPSPTGAPMLNSSGQPINYPIQ